MYNKMWIKNFEIAKSYYQKNKNLSVPKNFKTKDGINYDKDGLVLQFWIIRQRQAYKKGKLSENKIELLNSIGMKWNPMQLKDDEWEENYKLAKQYYKEHKNLLIPRSYKTINGKKLGLWIIAQRQEYKKNRLKEDRIKKLKKIKMVWNVNETNWNKFYKLAEAYYKKYGNLSIDYNFKTKDGINYDKDGENLGIWISLQKQAYKGNGTCKITKQQIKKLTKIKMIWNARNYNWNNYYKAAKKYYEEHKNLIVLYNYVTEDGLKLAPWITLQRKLYKENKLTKNKIKKLNKIGMKWDSNNDIKWNRNYELAKNFYNYYHHLMVPYDFKTKDGINYNKDGFALGFWIISLRRIHEKLKPGILTEKQIELLDEIKMVWKIDLSKKIEQSSDIEWMKKYYLAKKYFEEYGSLSVPTDTKKFKRIENWINKQKISYQNKELDEEKIKLLEDLNINWNIDKIYDKKSLRDSNWNYKYNLAQKYYEKYGNLDIPYDFATMDGITSNNNGVRLGLWIETQRRLYRNYNDYTLSEEKIKLLEEIGMIWFNTKMNIKLQKEKITSENERIKKIEILNRVKSYLLSLNQNSLPNKDEINKKFIKYLEKH